MVTLAADQIIQQLGTNWIQSSRWFIEKQNFLLNAIAHQPAGFCIPPQNLQFAVRHCLGNHDWVSQTLSIAC